MRGISWVADNRLVPQEELCSVEWELSLRFLLCFVTLPDTLHCHSALHSALPLPHTVRCHSALYSAMSLHLLLSLSLRLLPYIVTPPYILHCHSALNFPLSLRLMLSIVTPLHILHYHFVIRCALPFPFILCLSSIHNPRSSPHWSILSLLTSRQYDMHNLYYMHNLYLYQISYS